MLRRLKATDISVWLDFHQKNIKKNTFTYRCLSKHYKTKDARSDQLRERSKGEQNWLRRPHADRNIKQTPRDYQNVRRTKKKVPL